MCGVQKLTRAVGTPILSACKKEMIKMCLRGTIEEPVFTMQGVDEVVHDAREGRSKPACLQLCADDQKYDA
jgi:hypothetical protein